MNLQTVHLRVNDAETGQPTPCRIRISDTSGQEYAPFGRTLNFSTNRGEDVGGYVKLNHECWFSIDGACEIMVPAGDLRVQVKKGLDHHTVDRVIHQPAGKMSVRLSIKRVKNLGKPRWTTIDMRCHHATPHATALDAAAEDLDVVNLLAEPADKFGLNGNRYSSVPNLAAFSGQTDCINFRSSRVIVNTHHRHPMLGSVALLNCHRVVYPLTFGGADASDDWSLRDWASQCHRKGGLVVWTDPFSASKPHAGEALALAVLNKIDAYELTPDNFATAIRPWYQLLNAGIRLPIVGSSARVANDRPLGALQTVSIIVEGDWITHIKLGSCWVSNGPVPNISFDGNRIYASAISLTPFQRLELIANGEVVAACPGEPTVTDSSDFAARMEYMLTKPSWVAARVIDSAKSTLDCRTSLFGHTSAEWIGDVKPDPTAIAFLIGHLDRTRDWIETEGRFEQPKSKAHLLDTIAEARAKLGK